MEMILPQLHLARVALLFALISTGTSRAQADREMERLGRGVVAVHAGGGRVFVGWRLLSSDPADVAFNVYRTTAGGKPVRLNDRPLTGPTHFVDESPEAGKENAYVVRALAGDLEGEASRPFVISAGAPERPYLSIPLQTPAGYAPNDASAGDLDGDGEYEMVLHQASRGRG
jgi:rhamnogalacturonan endolyase